MVGYLILKCNSKMCVCVCTGLFFPCLIYTEMEFMLSLRCFPSCLLSWVKYPNTSPRLASLVWWKYWIFINIKIALFLLVNHMFSHAVLTPKIIFHYTHAQNPSFTLSPSGSFPWLFKIVEIFIFFNLPKTLTLISSLTFKFEKQNF